MTGPNPLDYGWWLASRSAGIVAILCVSLSVILGLMMANGLPRRRGAKRRLLAVHESTALAGLVAIAVHGLTLLGDTYIRPSLANIAVPFTIGYEPFFTGLGIVGGWLAALLGLSFYARRRIGPRLWRRMHRLTVAVWVLAVVHTLGAGSDAGEVWMQALLLVTGVPIVFLFLRRLIPEQRGAAAPRRAPAPRRAVAPQATAPARAVPTAPLAGRRLLP
jgi:sulfoxide reductase heme-binding subunit YedZ